MARRLKVGDTVKLKSGGPDMSVEDILGFDIICQWFAGKKLERGSFQSETLVLITQPGTAEKALDVEETQTDE